MRVMMIAMIMMMVMVMVMGIVENCGSTNGSDDKLQVYTNEFNYIVIVRVIMISMMIA